MNRRNLFLTIASLSLCALSSVVAAGEPISAPAIHSSPIREIRTIRDGRTHYAYRADITLKHGTQEMVFRDVDIGRWGNRIPSPAQFLNTQWDVGAGFTRLVDIYQ